jgi:hypothetical protein
MRILTRFSAAPVLFALLAPAAPAGAAVRGPDAAGYTATDATAYSFVDLTATGGAAVLGGADDAVAPLALPFAFPFYGQTYTTACVSTNGALYFAADAASCGAPPDFANTDLALATPGDRPSVFPLWSDLTFAAPGAGAILYQAIGAPGQRRFVVEWNHAVPVGSHSAVTFQAILFEGSGNVLLQYQTVDIGGDAASRGAQATIGIRNAGGQLTNDAVQWSIGAPVLQDRTAILFAAAPRDTTPPAVLVHAAPAALSATGGLTTVVLTGSVTDADSGIDAAAVTYTVTNNNGAPPLTGVIRLGAGDRYKVAIRLTASAGSVYTITVSARDQAGNPGSAAEIVRVQ